MVSYRPCRRRFICPAPWISVWRSCSAGSRPSPSKAPRGQGKPARRRGGSFFHLSDPAALEIGGCGRCEANLSHHPGASAAGRSFLPMKDRIPDHVPVRACDGPWPRSARDAQGCCQDAEKCHPKDLPRAAVFQLGSGRIPLGRILMKVQVSCEEDSPANITSATIFRKHPGREPVFGFRTPRCELHGALRQCCRRAACGGLPGER